MSNGQQLDATPFPCWLLPGGGGGAVLSFLQPCSWPGSWHHRRLPWPPEGMQHAVLLQHCSLWAARLYRWLSHQGCSGTVLETTTTRLLVVHSFRLRRLLQNSIVPLSRWLYTLNRFALLASQAGSS